MVSAPVIIIAVFVGALLGLLGGGGSILTVPLLVYGVGMETKQAIATSLLVVGLASGAALLSHARVGNVRWHTGLVFGAAGMVGAYIGGWLAVFVAGPVLLLLFATVMLGSGFSMVRPRPALRVPGDDAKRSMVKILADGFLVGAVTGLVGAGGGFLVVPALVLLGGMPMHAAVGTSLLVISLKCIAGLAGYAAHVAIDWRVAGLVAACAVTGTVVGSRFARRIPEQALRNGFGWFVLVVAGALIYLEAIPMLTDVMNLGRGVALALYVVALIAIAAYAFRCAVTPNPGPHAGSTR